MELQATRIVPELITDEEIDAIIEDQAEKIADFVSKLQIALQDDVSLLDDKIAQLASNLHLDREIDFAIIDSTIEQILNPSPEFSNIIEIRSATRESIEFTFKDSELSLGILSMQNLHIILSKFMGILRERENKINSLSRTKKALQSSNEILIAKINNPSDRSDKANLRILLERGESELSRTTEKHQTAIRTTKTLLEELVAVLQSGALDSLLEEAIKLAKKYSRDDLNLPKSVSQFLPSRAVVPRTETDFSGSPAGLPIEVEETSPGFPRRLNTRYLLGALVASAIGISASILHHKEPQPPQKPTSANIDTNNDNTRTEVELKFNPACPDVRFDEVKTKFIISNTDTGKTMMPRCPKPGTLLFYAKSQKISLREARNRIYDLARAEINTKVDPLLEAKSKGELNEEELRAKLEQFSHLFGIEGLSEPAEITFEGFADVGEGRSYVYTAIFNLKFDDTEVKMSSKELVLSKP